MARRLGVPPNTLSTRPSVLAHARLVSSRRDGRPVIYPAQFDTVGDLITFLIDKCCKGRPELCASAGAETSACVRERSRP
jgi:ArsR family transcriptional regulator, arsenate/arsenite/antimonite-responsive transcriptional repressor